MLVLVVAELFMKQGVVFFIQQAIWGSRRNDASGLWLMLL